MNYLRSENWHCYKRDWNDLRNAAGFAAACARLAMELYRGNHRSVLVASIEVAERYSGGEKIDNIDTEVIFPSRPAADILDAPTIRSVAYSAGLVVSYIKADDDFRASCGTSEDRAADAAHDATAAGVGHRDIVTAYDRWAARDCVPRVE